MCVCVCVCVCILLFPDFREKETERLWIVSKRLSVSVDSFFFYIFVHFFYKGRKANFSGKKGKIKNNSVKKSKKSKEKKEKKKSLSR
jgi:hypothetical protein